MSTATQGFHVGRTMSALDLLADGSRAGPHPAVSDWMIVLATTSAAASGRGRDATRRM